MLLKRKICVITGSRSEYGLLRCLIRHLHEDKEIDCRLIVTGSHLAPEFGLTWQEIVRDGFVIAKKVEILLSSDTRTGTCKSMGLALIGITDALEDLRPDIVVVLGDRFETFAAATAAMVCGYPLAHIDGGEITEGALDDAFRHCITKMAHLHFTATEAYRQRVIQLGEMPGRVFNVGGIHVDAIKDIPLLNKKQVEARLGTPLDGKTICVTHHPETLNSQEQENNVQALLEALKILADTTTIITLPNADPGSRAIIEKIREFGIQTENVYIFESLGHTCYLSLLQYVDAVVGNSSSGIVEAPLFGIGTVNIGDRQKGRVAGESVINVPHEKEKIYQAIRRAQSAEFKAGLKSLANPYGTGGAAARIRDILKQVVLEGLTRKRFYDLSDNLIVPNQVSEKAPL
ncbi:MAG: UDP-N-acetylglucosamine 2-epimerase [Thermincola sp.]|jgi:GDP/UDP-N,N'-diacetylbacillosamine 2-epimerase (hydrolysing)|nr:UDP-N-acetylglucosamine 2-epimerase [Thermincola sp.]MDT3704047.1 UDP-N-acetylglucosamine 2-epimerase [Thermincola sp.]